VWYTAAASSAADSKGKMSLRMSVSPLDGPTRRGGFPPARRTRR
jgi:hypothetical protein